MNEYEARIAAKKERLAEKAQAVRKESEATYKQAKALSDIIPFGQPILVGHHSERRHRKHLDKVGNTFRKSFELNDKADYYDNKADSVGTGGISSLDPEAKDKLQAKIDSLKANNEYMKTVNKFYKSLYTKAFKKSGDEKEAFKMAVKELGETYEDAAKEIMQIVKFYAFPPLARIKPYVPSTVEIRRLEKRIATLESAKNIEIKEIEKPGFKVVFDTEAMYIKFIFDGKPAEEIRNVLKRNAFKWSRYNSAWVRKLTDNARFSTKYTIEELEKLTN